MCKKMLKKKVKCVDCKKAFKVSFFWWCIQKLKDRKCGFVCDVCAEKWHKERDKLLKENDLKIEIESLERAKNFIISLKKDFLKLYNLELENPMIFPGINGDIDIEWKNNKFQLLISIPEDKKELAGLYGNDYGGDEIELDFDINKQNSELLSWLKRQK